jgi:hypothetical protein
MATATSTKKTSKSDPKAPTGLCGLTLRINSEPYKVRPLPAEFGGLKAFRLTKTDGTFHDVSRGAYGMECTSGDFVWRRDGIDPEGCKHIRSVRACGLL